MWQVVDARHKRRMITVSGDLQLVWQCHRLVPTVFFIRSASCSTATMHAQPKRARLVAWTTGDMAVLLLRDTWPTQLFTAPSMTMNSSGN